MFAGRYEISINVIAKHKKNVAIIWRFSLPGWGLSIFSVFGGRGVGEEKLLVFGLLGGISTQADTVGYSKAYNCSQSQYKWFDTLKVREFGSN